MYREYRKMRLYPDHWKWCTIKEMMNDWVDHTWIQSNYGITSARKYAWNPSKLHTLLNETYLEYDIE